MKKLAILILSLTFITCQKDYLEEEHYNLSTDVFNTQQGLEALLNEGYRTFRFFYGGDMWSNAWVMTGTDVLYRGRNGALNNFHRYQGIEATYFPVFQLWQRLYKALNESNTFLANVDNIYDDEDLGQRRKGEALFHRAHWLWQITEHFGDVHLTTEPSSGPEFTAVRSSKSEFYQQIESDLLLAIDLLPEQTETGRVNKPAAQAFLARMYLYNEEYDKARDMSQLVIDNPNYQLEDNYGDMWNSKQNSETNTEFLFSAIFTSDATNTQPDYGQHAWSSQFLALLQHPRPITDYIGAGFNRMATTRRLVELFDDTIDQRGAVMFGPDPLELRYAGDPSKIATVFLRHPITVEEQSYYDDLRTAQAGSGFPLVNILDINNIYTPEDKLREIGTFFDIRKIWNRDRVELNLGIQGVFNHPVIRLGEVYLIHAEAEYMQGNLSSAVNSFNELRRARAVPGQEENMEITAADLTVDFILEERGRELTHEQQRKFDLIRLGKLAEYVDKYNPEAIGFDPSKHTLLPIPQAQLDAMTPESAEAFGQNPGY